MRLRTASNLIGSAALRSTSFTMWKPRSDSIEVLADAQVGQVVTRRVAVLVVDADGLSASAELFVRIHITPADADGDFPPICKIKPWLPQCQEPMARVARLRRKEPA